MRNKFAFFLTSSVNYSPGKLLVGGSVEFTPLLHTVARISVVAFIAILLAVISVAWIVRRGNTRLSAKHSKGAEKFRDYVAK
jgi:hypothetical protein